MPIIWFYNNIIGDARSLVANFTAFCNDRSIASQAGHNIFGIGTIGTGLEASLTVYGFWDRQVWGGTAGNYPTLICPREEDRLIMPVGIISLDEVNIAGGRGGWNNMDFFLAISAWFWSMSPGGFRAGSGACVGVVNSNGTIQTDWLSTSSHGVRPVLSLNSNVRATGNGSATNPFIIQIPE